MMATPGTLHKEITAGKFKPAYYFFGAEDFRIAEAEKYVAQQFLPDKQLIINYHRIDGAKIPAADLMTELAALPMLGERQVFAVDNFQRYSAGEVDRILAFLQPPQPDRVVVFRSPSSKTPRKSSAFFKRMLEATEVVEFRRLTEREMAHHIQVKLKEGGIAIEPQALRVLFELIAGNRGALVAETSKLIDFKAAGDTITVDDVKQIVAGYEVFNIFQVADLIVDGDARRVLQSIESLLALGNSPATITTLLSQHFLSLYLVKNGRQPIGRRAFLVPKLTQQARQFENDRLEQIIIDIAEADAEIRRGRFKQDMALEILALRLVGERNPVHG